MGGREHCWVGGNTIGYMVEDLIWRDYMVGGMERKHGGLITDDTNAISYTSIAFWGLEGFWIDIKYSRCDFNNTYSCSSYVES